MNKSIFHFLALGFVVPMAAKAQVPATVTCPPDLQTAEICASRKVNLSNGFTATNPDFEARILYPAATVGYWYAPQVWAPFDGLRNSTMLFYDYSKGFKKEGGRGVPNAPATFVCHKLFYRG